MIFTIKGAIMKKIIPVLIVLLLLAPLSGCGEDKLYFPGIETWNRSEAGHPGQYRTIYYSQISEAKIKDWVEAKEYQRIQGIYQDKGNGYFFDIKEKVKDNIYPITELLFTNYYKIYYVADSPSPKKFLREISSSLSTPSKAETKAWENFFTSDPRNDIVEIGIYYHLPRISGDNVFFPRSRLFKNRIGQYFYLLE